MKLKERKPPAAAALFPAAVEREHWNDLLTRGLARAQARVAEGAVTPTLDLDAFKTELAGFDFHGPRPLGELLLWTITQMERGLVHVTHPGYFGLFNPAPAFPAQLADRIVAEFNPQLATSKTSPAAVEIEAHVIRAVAGRVGFPVGAGGHFTSGGSEANYTALLCALLRSSTEFASRGARAFAGPPVFYVSRDSHLAWLKIALQAGVGRSAARMIATDGAGRLDPRSLAEAIKADRASGCVPVMVAATAGTTNAGMIDPLVACAELARSAKLWYHVDAAWGGALVVSEKLRHVLAGIEQADSITVDAHKWLATTMGCGMFVVRDPSLLSSAFQVAANFMPSTVPGVDPYLSSVQWSRRFLGLRLFLSLAAAGWTGYTQHVERSIDLIALINDELSERGWSVVNQSPLAVLCVRPPPGSVSVRTIVDRVLASGRAWVAAARFESDEVIRICVTHGETSIDDVGELVETLQSTAKG
ncbi:MAG: pyridoxal-dependent decarboxylase [Candidatus Binataceae bacterium]|nr:pyridoxal-dependent decarboxylase [Candidatus Binataceae bacterium]